MKKNLLSIAGYDPSGGAGVLLDIRVFERLGFRGFGVLTAVTAQNSGRVERVFPVAPRAVASQYRRLSDTAVFAGIKVGMLGTAANLAAVARILAGNARIPRIIDPVFRSSSGAPLLENRARSRFLALLKGKADLITPNLDEAEVLAGFSVRTVAAMRAAAAEITRASRIPCLVKGGHLEGKAADVLFDGKGFTVFGHRRAAKDIHGTGCYLSAAILGALSQGHRLGEACGRGIETLQRAMRETEHGLGDRWVFSFNPRIGREMSPRQAKR